jgi:hypothetical protein
MPGEPLLLLLLKVLLLLLLEFSLSEFLILRVLLPKIDISVSFSVGFGF